MFGKDNKAENDDFFWDGAFFGGGTAFGPRLGKRLIFAPFAFVFVFALMGGFGNVLLRIATYEEGVPCTLIRAENVVAGDVSSYRIFCQEETFDLSDDLLTGNFNSSDVYGQIAGMAPGTEINLDVFGFRSGFLSVKRQAFRYHKDS